MTAGVRGRHCGLAMWLIRIFLQAAYALHQSWGVAFFDRFASAPVMRTNALYLHLVCNSIVFVLMHVQLLWSGKPGIKTAHAWLGRATLLFLTLGTVAALYLASEHDTVQSYGGVWAEWGFYSMSLQACLGVLCAVPVEATQVSPYPR